MKKYWKLIVFIFVTSVILISFYVKNASYSDQMPQFTIQTIEGDASVADTLIIDGQGYYRMNHLESFQIDHKGTHYLRDEAYSKRLTGSYLKPNIGKWQKDYRHFMRGKTEYSGTFHEGKDILAYVNIVSSSPFAWTADTFDIHILDKETKGEQHFQVQIPDHTNFWYQDIHHVSITGNELTVLSESYTDEQDGTAVVDVKRLTFDLKAEELLDEEDIYQAAIGNDDSMYEEIILHTRDEEQTDVFIVHQQTNYQEEEWSDGDMSESAHTTMKELIKYHVPTNEKEQIAIPKEVEHSTLMAFDDEKIYVADNSSELMKIIPYHFKDEVVLDGWEIDVQKPEDPAWVNTATVKNNTIYYLHDVYDGVQLPTIVAIDLEKEQLHYYGEIAVNKEAFNSEEVYFEQLFVQ